MQRSCRQTASMLVSVGVFLGLSLGGIQSSMAEIYKLTKDDGSVVFTDRIPKTAEGKTELLTLPQRSLGSLDSQFDGSNTYRDNGYTAPNRLDQPDYNTNHGSIYSQSAQPYQGQQTQSSPSNGVPKIGVESPNYTLQIISPSKVRAYRRPVQSVEVAVKVTPQLIDGDSVVMSVNGKQVATGTQASIATANLNPDKYVLEIKIVSKSGVIINSQRLPFYVIQNTNARTQQNKRKQAIRAYQQLPWYKRVLLTPQIEKTTAEKVSSAF